MGGTLKWLVVDQDTLTINGLSSWDGSGWDTLGSHVACGDEQSNVCAQVYWFLRYRNELYVNGGFSFLEQGDSVYQRKFARIDPVDLTLEGVSCHEPNWNGTETIVKTITNDTLYFTGFRGSLCGLPETNVFAYDGQTFQRWLPFDDGPFETDGYVGSVFKFRDRFYMTGLLDDSTSTDFYGFLRYTGSYWEPVPGFETPAPIKDILIHNDTLYIGGSFFEGPGVPGNMVVAYDGENWNNLGGGTTYDDQGTHSGFVFDLEWWHGKLLASGQFYQAGGVPIEHIAQWNGHHWCGSGADFEIDNPIHRMAIWRDSLYVVGGFQTIDGVPIDQVAKWDGGDFDAVCSPAVGVVEQATDHSLHPTLVDPSGIWWINLPEQAVVAVRDALGRLVIADRLHAKGTATIDLRSCAPGAYTISCLSGAAGRSTIKLLKP